MAKHPQKPYALHLAQPIFVAGDVLSGHVQLDLALAQQQALADLTLTLRGDLHSCLDENPHSKAREHVRLLRARLDLWPSVSAPTSSSSSILRLPFAFTLPAHLPPSFHAHKGEALSAITYSLHLTARRIPHLRERERAVFAILPASHAAAAQSQTVLRASLSDAWPGTWKSHPVQARLRQGLWGDHAEVEMKLQIPATSHLPINVPIPLKLDVTTRTKPLTSRQAQSKSDPTHAHAQGLFPAPPSHASHIRLRLARQITVRANGHESTWTEHLSPLGGFGTNSHSGGDAIGGDGVGQGEPEPPPAERGQTEWLHAKSNKTICVRSVRFETRIRLSCPPSFDSDAVSCKYYIHLCIPFPGIGNDVKGNIPITVVTCAPPSAPSSPTAETSSILSKSSDSRHSRSRSGGSVLAVDLPPSYWTGEYHDWDSDTSD